MEFKHCEPLTYGKPKRETVINNDDIINLNIALNTATTLEEFLKLT